MARLRRRWRVVKWAGVVIALCILVSGTVSVWWAVSYMIFSRGTNAVHGFAAAAGNGSLDLSYGVGPLEWAADHGLTDVMSCWSVHRIGTKDIDWKPNYSRVAGDYYCTLPLWIPFLVFALPTMYLVYRDRRIPPHCCQSCGYDLTGNTSGVCPECGEALVRLEDGRTTKADDSGADLQVS